MSKKNRNRGKTNQITQTFSGNHGSVPKPSSRIGWLEVFIAILLFLAIFEILYVTYPSANLIQQIGISAFAEIIIGLYKLIDQNGRLKSKIVIWLTILVGVGLFLSIRANIIQRNPCNKIITESGISPADTSINEVLVIVSDFRRVGNPSLSLDPSGYLFQQLQTHEIELSQYSHTTRIEPLKTLSINTISDANKISNCLNASIVFYGVVSEDRINYYSYSISRYFKTAEMVTSTNSGNYQYVSNGGDGEFILLAYLGQIYTFNNQFDRAEEYLNSAINWANNYQIVPDSSMSMVYTMLGHIEGEKGNLDLALNYLNSAISKSQKSLMFLTRGIIYGKRKQFELSLLDYNTSVDLAKKESDDLNLGLTYINRGTLQYLIRQPDKAIQDYESSIRIFKKLNNKYMLTASYNNRANVFLENGEHSSAINDFNKAINLSPSKTFLYNNRANCYLMQNDMNLAVANANLAMNMGIKENDIKQVSRSYSIIGLAYYQMHKYDLALSNYNEAIKLDNSDDSVYFNRGITYLILGHPELAINDFNQSININPENAGANYYLGKTYFQLGNRDQAQVYFDAALRLGFDPNNP